MSDLFGFDDETAKRARIGRPKNYRAEADDQTLSLPGMAAATEEDATQFLLSVTRQFGTHPKEAVRACEAILKLKRFGGYGTQKVEIEDPWRGVLDHVVKGQNIVTGGALDDVIQDRSH